ncbi:drug:proton antiporter [Dickeya fangzhongdai]|uniref:VOC family protein n=1 Tax=Dickeya fangzhongdai TaxID=1778540 RepID=UPI000574C158|nr:VOC family protein [Dickeya fangzhongdai]KHN57391.1 drug:proton antiporter [Dickeya fangzhongdai]
MTDAHYVLFYVDNPARSARFYGQLLDLTPAEQSPTFAMFALKADLVLGLWSKHTVEPAVAQPGFSSELAFRLPDPAAVDACYARWTAQDVTVVQIPTSVDFGYTFTVLDPDGHRLRVFSYPSA